MIGRHDGFVTVGRGTDNCGHMLRNVCVLSQLLSDLSKGRVLGAILSFTRGIKLMPSLKYVKAFVKRQSLFVALLRRCQLQALPPAWKAFTATIETPSRKPQARFAVPLQRKQSRSEFGKHGHLPNSFRKTVTHAAAGPVGAMYSPL